MASASGRLAWTGEHMEERGTNPQREQTVSAPRGFISALQACLRGLPRTEVCVLQFLMVLRMERKDPHCWRPFTHGRGLFPLLPGVPS